MNRCHPSQSQRPNRRKRPGGVAMNERKKSDSVGHSGPRTSPSPCQARSAPMMPNQPTIAIGRIAPTPTVSVNPNEPTRRGVFSVGRPLFLSAHFSPRGRAVSDLVSRRLQATAQTLTPRGKAGFEGAPGRCRLSRGDRLCGLGVPVHINRSKADVAARGKK
jgi:hypothetical protein